MNVAQDKILKLINDKKIIKTSDVAKLLKVSRQFAAFCLRHLVQNGLIVKLGSTRNSAYRLPSKASLTSSKEHKVFLTKKLAGLHEDIVYEEVARFIPLKQTMSSNVIGIFGYSFSEMLNNAIDHSKSKLAHIQVTVFENTITFTIRDFGTGIFKNIKSKFNLKNELDAIELLLKGKQTTMPERHSGQGIFFTSKIADQLNIRSHRLTLKFDNFVKDVFVGENRPLKGTEVKFTIRCRSKKKLKDLFDQYAGQDYEFDKTLVRVKLSHTEGLVSRSQARRIVFGLEKFKRVILDFKGVNEIGQAFADEIFRVFQKSHPNIIFETQNANSAVHMMILRAIKSS